MTQIIDGKLISLQIQDEIAAEVKKTHRDILEGTGITYLTPVTYDAEVYQRNSAQKSPVLVFFYGTDDEREVCASKRLAVVVKNLALHFGNKLKFCAYDEGKYGGGKATQVGTGRIFSETARREGIKNAPALILYNNKDKGVGGKVCIIDRAPGGPSSNRGILELVKDMADYWIRGNILELSTPDNDHKVYRYENSFSIKEITQKSQ